MSVLNKVKSLFLVVFMMSLFVSCGTKEDSKEKINSANQADVNVDESKDLSYEGNDLEIMNVARENEDIIDPKLLPDTEYIVTDHFVYLCYEVDDSKFLRYQEALHKKGYSLILEETIDDQTYLQYSNGESCIQVVNNSAVIFVSRMPVEPEMMSDESISTNQAILRIIQEQEEYDWEHTEKTEDTIRRQPAIVIRRWIKDLYEKTQIQAYVTYTAEGKESGMYLIHEEEAYAIDDYLDNTCIADIDENGSYELLSLYGFGSGIYRINLNVYQYENPVYFSGLKKILHLQYGNCFVPRQGNGQLKFYQKSDSNVHLKEDGVEGKDYGKLIIAEDGIHIIPQNMEDFPYYQWYIDFNPSNIEANFYESVQLDEVPTLTVKAGDTILTNRYSKIDWNGEKEDIVNFSDLMDEEMPILDCPSHFFEFKDEICFSFDGMQPTSIKVSDYLIGEKGVVLYGKGGKVDREVRYGDDGNYYVGLMQHWALMLSSSMETYTNPSYRGFRVTCEFGEEQTCEYVFVLSVAPSAVIQE